MKSHMQKSRSEQRGAVLPVVLILATVAAIAAATLINRVQMAEQDVAAMVQHKRAFYAADGMSRITIERVKRFMMEDGNPTTTELQDSSLVEPPSFPNYNLETYTVQSLGDSYEAPIIGGSFDGLNARQKPVSVQITARDMITNSAAEVSLMVNLAQISMFQYFVFANGYMDLYPGPNMTINPGRIHANGDLCIGSDANLQIEYVTSASRVLVADSRCRRQAGTKAFVTNGTAYQQLTSATSYGCTNCAGTGLAWKEWTESVFGPHLSDSARGTPALKLPISVGPAQAGNNAAGVTISNNQSIRLLVDPVFATDDESLKEQRYAWKADLRIINGVWYFNDGTWPGKPIWSDHPGHFITKNAEGIEGTAQSVGQSDLDSALHWSSVPSRYSYYEYNAAQGRLTPNTDGVISYGTVYKPTTGEVKPGYWMKGAAGTTWADVDGKTRTKFCGYCNGTVCSSSLGLYDATSPFCASGTDVSATTLEDAQLLQGTMGGFIDYRVRNQDSARGAILPINFDLAEFARAMADTKHGELGSYFGGNRRFNGIVYITSTWDGSLTGIPDQLAPLWPAQGAIADATQTPSDGVAMVQRGLPYNLCSDDLGYQSTTQRYGYTLPLSDGNAANGFEPIFTIPSCNSALSPTGRPNALRLINGNTIDLTRFPKGLSIVTNLPAYVMGSTNVNSSATAPASLCGTVSAGWIPMMIGADAMTLLSDAWSDANAPWDNSKGYSNRVGLSSTYRFSFIAGNVETVDATYYSGGVENFPRFLENWTNQTVNLSGAMIIGFSSVYERQRWGGGNVYAAPIRAWSFDTHLELMSCQPPGTPMFNVHSFTYLNESALN